MKREQNLSALRKEIEQIKKVMVTKNELRNLAEAQAVLGDPDVLGQIAASEDDIRAGRVKPIKSVRDLLRVGK